MSYTGPNSNTRSIGHMKAIGSVSRTYDATCGNIDIWASLLPKFDVAVVGVSHKSKRQSTVLKLCQQSAPS